MRLIYVGDGDHAMLPAELLAAIAHPSGGRVVLVVGAGCSREAPTSLPLGSECAQDAYRRLRLDGKLSDGDCADPYDLSCVADAVASATGGQKDLVERLPQEAFRLAEPNDGYLLAAAMLRERALSCVMTLNFDLAMSSALTAVGAQEDVSVIAGPEDHHRLGVTNLIYLHRNVNADPERWILRSSSLETEWRDSWEEVLTMRVLGAPVTVFAGLGTPVGVLVDTTLRIRKALPRTVRVYQVDPAPPAESAFFAKLGLSDTAYLQMGWTTFMRALADRLVQEHRAELERVCQDLLSAEGWKDNEVPELCARLAQMGLIRLGRLRARWILSERSYAPRDASSTAWLAHLLLAVGLIERTTGSEAIFGDDGVVEFRQAERVLGSILLASGRGIRGWLALETEIKRSERFWEHRSPRPRCVFVGGVEGEKPSEIAPPKNIAAQEDSNDIVIGYTVLEMFSVVELRNTPTLAEEILR